MKKGEQKKRKPLPRQTETNNIKKLIARILYFFENYL